MKVYVVSLNAPDDEDTTQVVSASRTREGAEETIKEMKEDLETEDVRVTYRIDEIELVD